MMKQTLRKFINGFRLFAAGVPMLFAPHVTIGQAPTGPGGVTGNIRVWMDGNKNVYSDTGITAAVDGVHVEQWKDQSQSATGPASFSTACNCGTAVYRANGVNYNGAVRLNNTVIRGLMNTPITSPNISNFMAVNSTATNNGHRLYVLYSNASGGYDYNTNLESIVFGLNGTNIQSHRTNWENPGMAPTTGRPMIATALTTSATHTLKINGGTGGTFNYAKGSFSVDEYFIGGGYAAGWNNSGTDEDYAEIVTYDRALTATETGKVESYMALKYGVTIDQTIPTDYVASDWNGTTGTRMWVNDADGYSKKIFGIGRDDNGQLYQKQSTSSDTGSVMALSIGNRVASTNALNTGSIATDKSFLSFAANSGNAKFTVAATGLNSTMTMARVWKVDKYNWTDQTITIQNIGTGAKYVIISTDQTFGAGDTEFELDGQGMASFNSSVLAHGVYVTFGTRITGPAGVNAGIAAWWRSDIGPSTNKNGEMATTWADFSGNGRDAGMWSTNTQRGLYTAAGINANFNPTMTFGGTRVMGAPTIFGTGSTSNLAFFTVSRATGTGGNGVTSGLFSEMTNNGNPVAVHAPYSNGYIYWDAPNGYRINSPSPWLSYANPKTTMLTFTRSPTNLNIYLNAKTHQTATGTYTATVGVNGQFAIGAYYPGDTYAGDIQEIIAYNPTSITTTERQKIHSYLALKYGITMDQSTAQDYLASDGTTKMWTNDNDGFKNRIFGMGRDQASYLNQKQSTSTDTGTVIWSTTLGSKFEINNLLNTQSIPTDKTFFTFADNNQTTSYLNNVTGTNVNERMSRVWKVDKSGSWVDQNVTFKAGAAYGSRKYLLISTTSNFATLTQELLLDATGSVTINSSLLPDGSFFTIGAKINGPANVNIGVAAWYRADDNGVTNTVWPDYSGNDNTAVQTLSPNQPSVSGKVFNYNPAMTFDGSNDHMIAPSLFSKGLNNALIFLVSGPKVLQNQSSFSELSNNGSYLENLNIWSDNNVYFDAPYTYRVYGASGAKVNTPYIWTMQRTPTAMNIWRNKTNIGTATGAFANYSGAGNFYIGGRQDLAVPYNGNIAELIVYNNAADMTANQMRAVETYLAVKYGTSLDSTLGNYLAYDSTVLWDQAANAGFRWRVTGLGRDDRSALNQKQSRNWDTTSSAGYAAMGLTNIKTTNALNTSTFSADKSYLIWGDNNGTGVVTTTVAGSTVNPANPTLFVGLTGCATLARFSKIFRVQKTGAIAPVQVQINNSGLQVGKVATDYYLAINNTNSFNSGTVQQLIQATSYDKYTHILTFDNVTFNSGDYFTVMGKKLQAPVNVISNIKLWLKAEDGITFADTSKISGWDDQSPAGNNVTQAATASQPTTSTNSNLINFNPTVKFDGNDILVGKSLLGTATYPGATFFTVSNQAVVNNNSLFYEFCAGGQFNLHATWSDNNVYWDAPITSNRIIYNTGGIAGQNILWSGFSDPSAAVNKRQAIYRNGLSMATGSGTTALTGTNNPFNVAGGPGFYNGRIGELIIYTAPLDTPSTQKINSYLSVKWGLSLDQTNPTSYYASDWNGTTGTKIWDATTIGTTYKYRITGIGRDDCSALNQLQSMNNDTTSRGFVTMGRGTISATNPGNPNTFAVDKSYILWGDNNATGVTSSLITTDGTTTIPITTSCVAFRRMAKIYTVAVTNTPGTVQVQFNVNGLSLGKKPADFYLAINNTSNFSGTTVTKLVPGSTFANGVVTFDNVTFTNGQFFTLLGQKSGSPATVGTAGLTTIQTWLKAEDGITLNGGNVSLWEDQSTGGRNAAQVTAGNQPAYNTTGANSINFNPSITSSAASHALIFSSGISNANMKVFAVGLPIASTGANRTLLRGIANDHPIIIQAGSTLYGYYDNVGTGAGFKSSGISVSGVPQIFGMDLTALTQTGQPSLNGKNGTLLTNIDASGGLTTDYLLNQPAGSQPWGTLSEMVVYNSTDPIFSTLSAPKIQSYLALKYGITLDQTTPTNYLASDGTVIWNAAPVVGNATYSNRITGIGRDDCSDFEQKQSRNVDTTLSAGWAMIALGDIYPDNISNLNSFANDKSFVIWGDDNVSGVSAVAITGDGATTLPQSGTCTQFRRLAKTFKVSSFSNGVAASNTGIQVSVNTRNFNFGTSTAGIYLAINNSNNFAGTVSKLVPASEFVNNTYTFDNITFNDGDYFTLIGAEAKAPANISNGLAVWLKAESGITLNGTKVAQWADQGELSNDVSQAIAANQPVYNANSSLLNFNPSVQFNGSTTQLLKANGVLTNGTVYTGATIFSVNNTEAPTAAQRLFRQAASADINLYAPHNNSYYFDAPDRISVGTTNFANRFPQITTAVKDNTGVNTPVGVKQVIYDNAVSVITGTGVATYTGNNGALSIGANNAGSEFHNGKLGELIYYTRALSLAERQKVNSYLSLKWGVSIDSTIMKVANANNNYVASDGTVIWNANPGYYNRVTGIGRDDCSDLNQKQSRNQDTSGAFVTIGLGNIGVSNAANNNTYTADKSFDVWADNGASVIFSTAVTPAVNGVDYRMACVWNVQETGTVGTVRIAIPANKVANPSTAYLMVKNGAATFNTGVTYYPLAAGYINGANTYYADVDLANNDFFTFGADVKSPGGVAGTSVWMRADYGTSSNIDSAIINEWDDYAANLKHAKQPTAGVQPLYRQNATDNINFNPVVSFDGSDHMDYEDQLGLTGTNQFTIATVTKPTSFGAAYRAILASSGGAGSGLLYAQNVTDGKQVVYQYNVGLLGASTSVGTANGVNARMTTRGAGNLYSFFNAGKADGTFTNAASYAAGAIQSLGGGYTGGTNSPFLGSMGDIIVYPFPLSATQRQQVETYLAIKYGYTIDQTTPTDYVATDGTTMVWDKTVNTGFANNIAGICRDDAEGLNQNQSKSVNAGLQPVIGAGSIVTDNLNNGNDFANDLTYLTWGDNAGATTYLTAVAGAPVNSRMTRLWKTQTTNTVGNVQVAIPYNAIANPAATYLIRSTDATIDGSDTYVKMDSMRINGTLYYAATTTFNSGDLFTFGSNLKLPGGVTGVSLWLRPDYGTSSTTDGSAISEWLDAAGYVNNATQSTAANQPVYKNNTAANINFNPVIAFDGASDQMSLDITRLPVGNSRRALIGVARTATVSGAHAIVGWGQSPNLNGSSIITLNADAMFDAYGVGYSAPGIWQTNVPNEMMFTYQGGTNGVTRMFSKGKSVAANSTLSLNTTGTVASIGNSSFASYFWNGSLGDVIVYPDSLNALSRQRIESYLSVKYGYTMDQTSNTDYLASDGTTVTWPATTPATDWPTYKNRITGIGRDDLTALNQLQSRNMDTTSPGFVTMGIGSIAVSNTLNDMSFPADLSFELWGDDGVGGTSTSTVTGDVGNPNSLTSPSSCVSFRRIAKTFKVAETGTVGGVQVSVNMAGLAIAKTQTDIYLAINSTSTFTGNIDKLVPASSFVNGVATFNGVDFTNGQYFTVIGQKVFAPANISSGLRTWLKAEDGITLNGSTVQQWDDQGAVNLNAAQGTAANQPGYATSGINFNPALTFNGTSQRMLLDGTLLPTGTSARTIIAVTNAAATANKSVLSWGDPASTAGTRYSMEIGGGQRSSEVATGRYGNTGGNTTVPGITTFTNATTTANAAGLKYLNGASLTNAVITAGNQNINTSSLVNAYLGDNVLSGGGTGWYNGQVSEVLVYNRVLSSTEQKTIESYLALKYGITQDQTTPTNYVASDGTVLWNATTNATYKNRIFGIGQDNCNDLIQRQSKSSAVTSSLLTMALGTIAANNATNLNSFVADKDYVIVGDDNGTATEQTTDLPPAYVAGSKRLAREWKAAINGSTSSNLEMQFDLSSVSPALPGTLTAADMELIIDNDGDGNFTTGTTTVVPASSLASNTVTFDNVSLSSGVVFTVVTKAQKVIALKLDAKVLLQGPMGASVMTTTLNTSGLLPKTQPYTTSPFSYFGTEAVTTMPSNVTDWVMIELRDPVTPATLIARRVGLMLNTGDIKDVDGASPISFTGVPAGNYYVAVKSRNSLPIRSAGTMNFSVATTTSYDFTTSLSQAYNVAGANTQMVLINGKWCLWTADVNGDGSIDGSDFNTVDNEVTNGTFGYIPQDVNMDGVVDGTDFNYTDANTAQGLFYTPN